MIRCDFRIASQIRQSKRAVTTRTVTTNLVGRVTSTKYRTLFVHENSSQRIVTPLKRMPALICVVAVLFYDLISLHLLTWKLVHCRLNVSHPRDFRQMKPLCHFTREVFKFIYEWSGLSWIYWKFWKYPVLEIQSWFSFPYFLFSPISHVISPSYSLCRNAVCTSPTDST